MDIKLLEQEIAEYQETIQECWRENAKIQNENAQLKQQLAEKEKEIDWLKEEKSMTDNCVNILTKKLKEKEDDFAYIKKISHELGLQNLDYEKQVALLKSSEKCLAENLKKTNQDKISFAVEQLEKVRTQFRTKYSWYEEIHRVCEKTDNFVIWLDNQIKQLKEGMM